MSPEQAAGRLDLLGPASDVYSLGATLYTLLTGRPPFAGEDLGEVLRKVQRGEFPRPRESSPWLDPALEAICLKAMALKPEDRYASPRALADDLERWLADEPVSAYREPFAAGPAAGPEAPDGGDDRRRGRARRRAPARRIRLGRCSDQRRRTDAAALAALDQAERLAIEARATSDPARGPRPIAEARRAEDRLESGGGSRPPRPGARSAEACQDALRAEERGPARSSRDLDEARLRGRTSRTAISTTRRCTTPSWRRSGPTGSTSRRCRSRRPRPAIRSSRIARRPDRGPRRLGGVASRRTSRRAGWSRSPGGRDRPGAGRHPRPGRPARRRRPAAALRARGRPAEAGRRAPIRLRALLSSTRRRASRCSKPSAARTPPTSGSITTLGRPTARRNPPARGGRPLLHGGRRPEARQPGCPSTSALALRARGDLTGPSPSTARRSGSSPTTPRPTTTSASPWRPGEARPGHRRVPRGDPAQARLRRGPLQPRHRPGTQGKTRPGHRRIPRGDPAQARPRRGATTTSASP